MSVVMQMEMPNGCHDCKLRNMIGNCPIPMFDGQDEEKIWTLAECFQRPSWCPIICSLPKGHGRLIDADAYDYPGDLKWEPTIVPAEGEKYEKCSSY